ncbi:hypothetical protein [Streptomyces flavofungini]|uniref:Uncharacterized protein n=1 Tax=Streptomyces flavofungini TaxID=68200 RepID=A0ABS0XGG4_9ACTN|nr:hypothetical protein [Streptomyces flavofungini]MBJ3812304.1 hypothetical protein [Streptomyces flavofungini]GHC88577.1 hypothetical protein GCM10010349_75950 [Streptomyces flavofungini]
MAAFHHITPERCAYLTYALDGAGLDWKDNGRQDAPEFLTYTVTGPHGREWSISPATSNQIVPSKPLHLWQAACAETYHRTDRVMTAGGLADLIRSSPK